MPQAQPFEGKHRRGRVTLERFRDSIRLRWTLNKKTYSLTIGSYSKDTVKAARAKAQIIDGDIIFERFDPTLARYGKPVVSRSSEINSEPCVGGSVMQQGLSSLTVRCLFMTLYLTEIDSEISLRQLWDEFVKDKLPSLKPKSQDEYHKLTALLNKLGSHLGYNSLEVKNALLAITTTAQTRRVLQYLSASCNWGIKHHKLKIENPFFRMACEMPKRKSVVDPSPNAFTLEEREAIIAAFKNDSSSPCHS